MEQDAGIELTFDFAESAVMKSKDKTFIFYLNIRNKLPKQVNVKSPRATYLTVQGEEIEQDFWLGGLVDGDSGSTIRSGAFKKMGIVMDQQKLLKISSGDRLYVTINLPKSAQRFNFGFVCSNETEKRFTLCESNHEEIVSDTSDVTISPAQASAGAVNQTSDPPASNRHEITNLVERLELLEEKCGVAISGIYATHQHLSWVEPPNHHVEINFDVASLGGGALEHSLKIYASAYNDAGQLLKTEWTYLLHGQFMGFESQSIEVRLDQAPARIRLLPTG